jgi:pimeloyl-ACP methyl ester carboxylesterase
MHARFWVVLALALGCSSDAPGDTAAQWDAPSGGVLRLDARDGVKLEADYLPADREGAPSVLLLHMVPPSNTRADWPPSLRERFAARGWTVVAIDRRGAGGSEGDPVEAYTGEKGKFDVEPFARRVVDDGFGPLAILGASNGTTSMIDYAAWAPDVGLPEPVALGFLSGGSYTENQTWMSEVPAVPMSFLYPPDEAAWPDAQRELDPGSWSFKAYEGGAHGTRLFTSAVDAEVQADLEAFLAAAFGE